MQSTARVIKAAYPEGAQALPQPTKGRALAQAQGLMQARAQAQAGSSLGLALEHLPAPVKTVGADVVAQMHLAGGGLDRHTRNGQGIVRAVHTALGRRLFVLLNGHGRLLCKNGGPSRAPLAARLRLHRAALKTISRAAQNREL